MGGGTLDAFYCLAARVVAGLSVSAILFGRLRWGEVPGVVVEVVVGVGTLVVVGSGGVGVAEVAA